MKLLSYSGSQNDHSGKSFTDVKLFSMRRLLFFLATLFLSFFSCDRVHAAIETCTNSVTGSSVETTASATAIDNKYTYISTSSGAWRGSFSIASAVGRVRVGYDHTSLNYVSADYDYTFYLKIQYQDSSVSGTTTIYKQLRVSYDPDADSTYHDAGLYEVNNIGVIWIKATIDSIHDNVAPAYVSDVPDNMFLEASTVVERYYVISYSTVPSTGTLSHYNPAHTSPAVDSNEVQVYWNYIAGAENYQLEWCYVNDYNISGGAQSTDSLQYDFAHNSTRITTTGQTYNIPLLFDKGYLMFRLRACTKVYDASSSSWKWVYGKWTSDQSGAGTANTVTNFIANLGSGHYYHITSAHEGLKNWQYVGTFAEEGKKKEVVSYYDGTLRNRQTVTKTSTDKKVLVGETIYDFQGRAAVTALPAPVQGTDQELRFYDGFNRVDTVTAEKTYSRFDFDYDAGCVATTLGMKTSTGASNYYSSSNSETTFGQAFLPNANKYPFAQVEYMPDNTGRVRAQGGVGPDHQLASNHATQYYYGQPFQEELDRIFGSDAGFKKHYNKTVTIDANGQASVTYLDQEGRTVATALAGKNPYNLDPLEGASGDTLWKTNTAALNIDLLGKDSTSEVDSDHDDNILSTDGTKLSTNTQLTVPFRQKYSFSYSLTGSQFTTECMPDGICYQCVYDLTIKIKDQCGNNVVTPVAVKVGTFDTTSSSNPTFSISSPSLDVTLDPGSYTVTKVLTVDNDTLEKYWENYLAQNTCVRTQQSFLDSAQAHIDTTGCHLKITDESDYISPCDAAYQMLLSDVSPNGQYAQFLVQGSPAPSQYPVSVLNDGQNFLPHSDADWRHPMTGGSITHYYEADGTTVSRVPLVEIDSSTYIFNPAIENSSGAHSNLSHNISTGVWSIEPQYLDDVSDFVNFWESSWAVSLVEYHPEYCFYSACKGNTVGQYTGYDTLSSDEFDSLLYATNTVSRAHSLGLLDPLGNYNGTPSFANCKDPFFRAHGLGHGEYDRGSAPDACEYSQNYQGNNVNIWKLTKITTACGTIYGNSSDVTTCLTAAMGGSLPAVDTSYIVTDADWKTFRSLYLSIKQHFQNYVQDSTAHVCGGYNDCIGNDNYYPATAGMYTGSPMTSWPFFTHPSPCGLYSSMFTGKIRRFVDAEDLAENMNLAWGGNPQVVIDSMQSQGDYNFNEATGQCPMAFGLQQLLNQVNDSGYFSSTVSSLAGYQLSPDMYNAITASAVPYHTINWDGTSNSGSTFTAKLNSAGCTVALTFPSGCSLNWSNLGTGFVINSFSNLVSDGAGGFTVNATIDDDNNPATPSITYILTGTTSCFSVSCSFPGECVPNTMAHEIFNLVNMLAANGDLYNTGGTSICLTTGSYGSYFIPTQLRAQLTGAGPYYWTETASSSNIFKIWNGVNNYPGFIIRIPSLPVSGVTSFSDLLINNPDSTANMTAYDGSNHSVSFDLDWDHSSGGIVVISGLDLGSCGQQVPTPCQGEVYQRRADMETFLSRLATGSKLANNAISSLFNVPQFTTTLSSVFGTSTYLYSNNYSSGNTLNASILDGTDSSEVCSMTFAFDNTPGGGDNWTNVKTITNIVADEMHMVNGEAYSFTAIAWFNDNTSMSITGTSCWGIRNCSECMANAGNIYNNFDHFNSGSPGFTTTLTYDASCPATGKYTVTKSATTLCSDTTLTGQDHTQPGTGSYYYTKFNNNGAQTLWSTTTTAGAFTAYTFSCWYMNNWTDSTQHNVVLELWANGTKVAYTTVADTAPGVWQKLSGVWNGSSSAGSITIEIKTSGSSTRDTRLGIDDIGFYTAGCEQRPVFVIPDSALTYPYCDSCRSTAVHIGISNGYAQYAQYMDSVKADFKKRYIAHCMGSAVELFNVTDTTREYHYTLYYYDQGGNLVRTIPPAGVSIVDLITHGTAIKHDRAYRLTHPTASRTYYTTHTLATTYTYNTLNQLEQQVTPDGDTTHFWYDKLGRIVASQNAKQKAYSTPRYSYTVYDAQGRISEVGELATGNNLNTAAFSIKQTWLNDYSYPDLLDGAVVSGSNYRYQVTKTYYDAIEFSSAAARFSSGTQSNLRKRVATAAIYENYTGGTSGYNSATHYSYDIHGNVQELVQENTALTLDELKDVGNSRYQTFKNMIYTYDLVSGKVNTFSYDPGQADQYYYKYEYDADNRVTCAYSSTDNRQWDKDAKYFYLQHGPLYRTEIGNDKVQGVDYAYTLHGWIKGTNSNALTAAKDMGADAGSGLNAYTGLDQYGYELTYYDTTGHTDYTSITTNPAFASQSGASIQTTGKNLWDGNIKDMITSIESFMPNGRPQGRNFKYDQLNRITGTQVDTAYTVASNSWTTSGSLSKWKERFFYDENGNITQLRRHGNVTTPMDSLIYHYYSGTNQLEYVDDISSAYSDDIDDQSSGNYTYDKIGNLVHDVSQEIDSIQWNVNGKISKVIRTAGSNKADLEFHYDAMGNRICKIVKPRSGGSEQTEENWTYTYYVRDAQGNIISTYEQTMETHGGTTTAYFKQKENDLYGSSRVGVRSYTQTLAHNTITFSGYHSNNTLNVTGIGTASSTAAPTNCFAHKLGEKSYELANHLGNVLVTVSDARIPSNGGSGTVVISFGAKVVSATDYYVFGSPMEGRNYQSSNYAFAMNGQEKDDEVIGSSGSIYTAQFWEYDSRLGRRWNMDPKPNPSINNYACFENNPIGIIDLKGDTAFRFDEKGVYMATVDDGKTTWSMQIYHGTTTDPVTGATKESFTSYQFNDPNKDVADMKNLTSAYGNTVPLVFIKSSQDIAKYMDESGVTSEVAQGSYDMWDYAYSESRGSNGRGNKMDFWNTYLSEEEAKAGISESDIGSDRGGFYIFQGEGAFPRVYNAMDAGNYLWGASMCTLGFSLGGALVGANADQMYDTDSGGKDSKADQFAIIFGFYQATKLIANKTILIQ